MVEDTIFREVHKKRYTLAGEAPICNGELLKEFGYTANTRAAGAMLIGTYVVLTDSDSATEELFREIAAIRRTIPANLVSITITPTQWQQYWKIVNKEMSLSESGLHFGHYIVGCNLETITHYHAARVTVTLAHAIQLEQWLRGLSVMLEKMLGVMLVTKLRAILLMEADYNATNKIIYGISYAGFTKFYLFKYLTRRVEVITINHCQSIQQLNQLKILVYEAT